tara:strand:+ start:5823 stop:6035 length:213 start_codon:yes stop_codon:yes gene_type:complete
MKIIREVRPNGLPLMLQAVIGDCGLVTEGSLMVFPLINVPNGSVFIGEELGLADSRLAERLNLVLHNDTT